MGFSNQIGRVYEATRQLKNAGLAEREPADQSSSADGVVRWRITEEGRKKLDKAN